MTTPAASHVPEPGLEDLLRLVTPLDTCRGMFFNGAFEIIRSLGGEDVLVKSLAAAGGKRFVDFFSYPVADFLRALFTAAELLGPSHGGQDAVMRQLGRRATEDFLRSTVGKTMLALAGTEPQRLLTVFPRACRASVSYGDRSVELLGDKRARMRVRRDFLPLPYIEGVLMAALEHSTARDLVVRGYRLAPLDVDYELSWS